MPWTAPGASPIADSCGIASGFKYGAKYGKGVPHGYKGGEKGSEVLPALAPTLVKAGGELDVGFGFEVNHGGGYAYRLCPLTAGQPLSEECFRTHPLDFIGDNHTIRYLDGSRPDAQIDSHTSFGTSMQ